MYRYASLAAALLLGALVSRWHYGGGVASAPEYYSEPLGQVTARLRALSAAPRRNGRVVMVTGAAGFIGFHTALQLQNEGDAVIGLDNFNTYYDVRLKKARHALLKGAGMNTLIQGDVCDAELLRTILREGRVTHVIHLAAQAGVRYSLKKPLTYVEANVRCFVTLLEAVHAVNNSVPIAYASSSSVYGLNTVIPFSETHQVDRQACRRRRPHALSPARPLASPSPRRPAGRPPSMERRRSRTRTSHTSTTTCTSLS